MPEKSKAGRGPYPPEVRERAGWSSITKASTPRSGKPSSRSQPSWRSTTRLFGQWVRRAETDAGERPGLTTDERARMKELEKENFELRRANEILKAASAFFAAELDPATAAASCLHRRTSPPLRGRADLPGAHRARRQDRPEHLLGGQEASTRRPARCTTRS